MNKKMIPTNKSADKEFFVNTQILSTGEVKFGSRTNRAYLSDPKTLLFNLSRYKFVAKMFSGYSSVLEVGCGDAFGSSLVAQTVGKLTATDLDVRFIEEAKLEHPFSKQITFCVKDFTFEVMERSFDAAFCLDVLEHIPKELERKFLQNILQSIGVNATLIVGMPSIESQLYASELSKRGHVNCKTADELKDLMLEYFQSVFIFSMNDEVLHTGFAPMSHYIFALCVSKK